MNDGKQIKTIEEFHALDLESKFEILLHTNEELKSAMQHQAYTYMQQNMTHTALIEALRSLLSELFIASTDNSTEEDFSQTFKDRVNKNLLAFKESLQEQFEKAKMEMESGNTSTQRDLDDIEI